MENGELTSFFLTPGDLQATTTIGLTTGTSIFFATTHYEEEIEEKQPDGTTKTKKVSRRKLSPIKAPTTTALSISSVLMSEVYGAEMTNEQYQGIDNQATVIESFAAGSEEEQDAFLERLIARANAQEEAEIAELAPTENTVTDAPKQLIRK